MKIAVIGTYPPQKDGIGIYSSKLVKGMQDDGHEVKVFSFKGNEAEGVVGCLSKNNPFSYLSTAFRVKKFRPDKVLIQHEYVHYNMLWFPGLVKWLWLLGLKSNIMMHTVAPYSSGWKAFVFKVVHLLNFFFCRHAFVHTQVAKEKLLERCWIKPKVDVVPIAIDPQAVPKLPKGKKLLSFGFISSDKGLDVLCRAVKGLHVDVTIAGSVSPYAMKKQHDFLSELKKLCDEDNITLLNRFVSEEEKEKLFKETDYFVLPYRFIEQSAVLTEVWGYGKIPICSDVPGFKEEIGDGNGVLFTDGDDSSLRGAIEDIISNTKKQRKILDNIKKLQKERSFNVCAKKVVEKLV